MENKLYIVYMHRNQINNKCYVGRTCQKPETRWGKNGWHYHDQPYFYRAIEKYGWNNFEHIILEVDIPEEKIDERECYWGGYYHALAPEGYSLSLGRNDKKISSFQSIQTRSEASKKKWANKDYQQKVSDGRRQMWQEATKETKQKMLSNLDRSGKGGKARSKAVECIETHTIYKSMRDAERATGISHANISLVCNGKRKTANGFHWRFVI